jgi:hypothetical protein
MADVMEDHIRDHIGRSRPSKQVTEDLPAVVRNCASENQRLAAREKRISIPRRVSPKYNPVDLTVRQFQGFAVAADVSHV